MKELTNMDEAARARAERLQRIADRLLEKVSVWVEGLDPQEAGSQTLRQICATLKDLKDIQGVRTAQEEAEHQMKLRKLQREAEGSREERTLTVTIAGGEEPWKS